MENTSSLNSTEQIISAVAQLSLSELERVFDRVLALQAERRAAHLSPVESKLLVRINQGLPIELRERLIFLKARREDESITDAEYEELTRLSDQAEELHAEISKQPHTTLTQLSATTEFKKTAFRVPTLVGSDS